MDNKLTTVCKEVFMTYFNVQEGSVQWHILRCRKEVAMTYFKMQEGSVHAIF
jgi:hypothetical protein